MREERERREKREKREESERRERERERERERKIKSNARQRIMIQTYTQHISLPCAADNCAPQNFTLARAHTNTVSDRQNITPMHT